MIILLVVLVALAVAFARGGRFSNLARLNFRFVYLLFLPLLLQLIIYSPLPQLWHVDSLAAPFVYIFSILIGALVLALNWRLPGFKLIFIGLLSNLIVIAANGGFMPVSMPAREMAGLAPFSGVYNNVIEMSNQTWLWFLGDLFPIPKGFPFPNVFSIGDVLIAIGGVILIQGALLGPKAKAQDTSDIVKRESHRVSKENNATGE